MTSCAVVGCKSSSNKKRYKNHVNFLNIRFCSFPKDEKLRKIWLHRCGREENCQAVFLFVCLKHFTTADLAPNSIPATLNNFSKSRKKIKPDAVPSMFLPHYVEVPEDELKDKVPITKELYTSQPKRTIPAEKPETPTVAVQEPQVSERMQLEFIDHVVMVFLNRCRSRAQNPNIGMSDYILKGKAQEAAVFLGVQKVYNGFVWLEVFRKKLAEHDAKGIALSTKHESVEIADIINDEYQDFARKNGLSAIRINGVVLSISPTSTNPKNESNKTSPIISTPEISNGEQPYHTSKIQDIIMEMDENNMSKEKFLRHILITLLKRFKARFPEAEIPNIVLKKKFLEASSILELEHIHRNQWLIDFKSNYNKIMAGDTNSIQNMVRPVPTNFPESLEISDIIATEWPVFLSEHYKSDNTCDSMENSISQKNTTDECFDSIQTYEEALDCLYLLSNYATNIGDLKGLSLLKQIDSFLKSEDYE